MGRGASVGDTTSDDGAVRLQTKYDSEIESVNFELDAKKIEGDVNHWVSEKTNGMIKKLLQDGTFDKDTRLVIVTASYFKGMWIGVSSIL